MKFHWQGVTLTGEWTAELKLCSIRKGTINTIYVIPHFSGTWLKWWWQKKVRKFSQWLENNTIKPFKMTKCLLLAYSRSKPCVHTFVHIQSHLLMSTFSEMPCQKTLPKMSKLTTKLASKFTNYMMNSFL